MDVFFFFSDLYFSLLTFFRMLS